MYMSIRLLPGLLLSICTQRSDQEPQKVGVFTKLGTFFRLNIIEKESFPKVENTDQLVTHSTQG